MNATIMAALALAGLVTLVMCVTIVTLAVELRKQREQAAKREERLLNRLMAEGLGEYTINTKSLERTHEETIDEMDKENELALNNQRALNDYTVPVT